MIRKTIIMSYKESADAIYDRMLVEIALNKSLVKNNIPCFTLDFFEKLRSGFKLGNNWIEPTDFWDISHALEILLKSGKIKLVAFDCCTDGTSIGANGLTVLIGIDPDQSCPEKLQNAQIERRQHGQK